MGQIFKEVPMSTTRLICRLAIGLAVLAAACWIVTGTFPLAAAPQVANDSPGVTVDLGAAALQHRAPVSYPESARKQGVQGTVTVEATLDGVGNVSDAHVVSGPEELRKAALQSVLQWHFRGAEAGTTRTVSIAFQLTEAQSQSPLKQINPELQAKIAEARAHPPNVEQYVGELRNGSSTVTRTLKSIVVLGLSDQMHDELLSRLPVHEGDTLTNELRAKVETAVRQFDEHLVVGTRFAGAEATLTVAVPNYSPAGAMEVKTNGPKLVQQTRPVYPAEAKAARISGVVTLSAIIAADGTVKKVEVIGGHPLLAPAAVEAVRQWVYQPTLLNGNPVEVTTQISVNFTFAE
jgi:TonB family protein